MRSLQYNPFRRISAAVVLSVALVAISSCSGQSEPREVAVDIPAMTAPPPIPTAPPPPEPGQLDANAFLRELEGFATSPDLCGILTGESFRQLNETDFNMTGLASNPGAITRLYVAIDDVFNHLVEISPEDLRVHTSMLRGAWEQILALDPNAEDNEAQVQAILLNPEFAQAALGIEEWTNASCELPSSTTTAAN